MEALLPEFELLRPEWLAALVVLPVLVRFGRRRLTGFSRRRQTATLVCRSCAVAVVVLALSGIWIVKPSDRKFVVVAVDQSESIADAGRRQIDAFVTEVQETAGDHRVVYLPFARSPGPLSDDWISGSNEVRPGGTDLEAAILTAAAAVPS